MKFNTLNLIILTIASTAGVAYAESKSGNSTDSLSQYTWQDPSNKSGGGIFEDPSNKTGGGYSLQPSEDKNRHR